MRAEHGQCPLTALLVVNRVPLAMDAVLRSDDDKQTLRAFFEVAARGGAETCALVAEGWRVGGTERKLRRAIRYALDGHSLADLRGRREILFVHAVSARAEILHVFEITKRGALRRASADPSGPVLSRFLTALPRAAGKARGRGASSPPVPASSPVVARRTTSRRVSRTAKRGEAG
jgi:hypothetical protein